jgi:VWFA-related protein
VAVVASSSLEPSAASQQSQVQPPHPTFRGGAVLVRLDVFAAKDSLPVADLTADDLEISEDGVRQEIAAFEHVTITTSAGPSSRVEPRTAREMRDMAGDPRARLFLIFLDKPHLRTSSGYRIIRPLGNFLRRLIDADDMVGFMTPEMSALDVVFTRRADRLAAMLQSANAWEVGTSSRVISDDPVEEAYQDCFTDHMVRATEPSEVAREMIERRREKRTIDALTDLARYVGGLREERKAMVLVSEGYRLFRPNPGLVRTALATTNPDGSPRTRRWSAWCEAELRKLAELDNHRLFLDLLGEANHANVSFYPVDPRGLAVFDSEMGPSAPPPVDIDMQRAHGRQESLDLAARLTDGQAVITNDIDAGLQRVVADLSSYYLVGYVSTNSRLDGRFRAVTVRSRRPGVEIRARRGYQVPTAAEVAASVAAAAPRVVDDMTAAVEQAFATLGSARGGSPLRVRVSAGWWQTDGALAGGPRAGASPALWVVGEVDVKGAAGQSWSRGGRADVAVSADSGEFTAGEFAAIGPSGAFVVRVTGRDGREPLVPGPYSVRVRAAPTGEGSAVAETLRVEVPSPDGTDGLQLGGALYARRGQATGNKEVATADLQFHRTERVIVESSVTVKPESVTGELLDRAGQALAVPVVASLVEREGVVWVRGEVALAALAPGDYVVRLTAARGSATRHVLAPLRLVP